MATSFKRLWTVCLVPYVGDDPIVDLVYCGSEPTREQIASVHPHWKEWMHEEFDWSISEYTKPDNAPRIPSIL